MSVQYSIRYSSNPLDAKHYDSDRLRNEFLIQNIMVPGQINMVYTIQDRFIIGGAVPVDNNLLLESIEPLKADFFLQRREIGIINIGGKGIISVDGKKYVLHYKEAIYVGANNHAVLFSSEDKKNPARFYFNSAPAHTAYPVKHITLSDADVVEAGKPENANARRINKLIVNSRVQTCQLQMGLTELQPGSVWNTMPAHIHDRRNEVYFYFNIPPDHAVCHFTGEPKQTRHIWVHNEEAVVSPTWSLHSGCGTSNYNFIWGMAGENLDYGDMDIIKPDELI